MMSRYPKEGVAFSRIGRATESQSLSALCGGRAALYGSKAAFFTLALIVASAMSALGQTPTPSPDAHELQVPAIAPDYNPEDRPLPVRCRGGVVLGRKHPLTLPQAFTL